MEGHVVVCGLGQVGYRVVSLFLDLGIPVRVLTLDARSAWVKEVVGRGAQVTFADLKDSSTLDQAELSSALAVLAVTSSDATNIEVALDVKRRRPDLRVVARIFDQTLARELTQGLGIDRALAMSTLAAPAIASAALGDHVASEFSLDGTPWVVLRVPVLAGGPWIGRQAADAAAKRGWSLIAHLECSGEPAPQGAALAEGDVLCVIANPSPVALDASFTETVAKVRRPLLDAIALVNPIPVGRWAVAVLRGTPIELKTVLVLELLLAALSVVVFQSAMGLSWVEAVYFVVTTLTTTGYGDITPKGQSGWLVAYATILMLLGSALVATLYSILTDSIIKARLSGPGALVLPRGGHVVVAGLGDVGFRVVEQLLEVGAQPVVVDSDSSARFVPGLRRRVPIVLGDARDRETLASAGVATARAVVAVTGDDATNLSIGLVAKSSRPGVRAVVRVFEAEFARKVQESLGIDAAVSASRIAAPEFVGATLEPQALATLRLGRRLCTLVPASRGIELRNAAGTRYVEARWRDLQA